MKKHLLSILIISFNITSYAGGFKLGLQGNSQLGIGHTGIGFAQDAATIYFNPAGMGFVKSQLTGNLHLLAPSVSFLESSTNTLTNSTGQVFTPFSIYGSATIAKKVSLGLGVYTPFGSGVMYPNGWSGRYVINTINLQTIYIQPSISYKFNNNISLGAGYIFANGNLLLEKDLPIVSPSSSLPAYAQLKGKGKGNGYNLGIYVAGNDNKFGFGITYHSKVKMNLESGDANFYNIPTSLASNFPAKNKFSSSINLPSELGVGASIKLAKNVTAALDITNTFWSSYDSLGFDYQTNSSALTDAKSPRLYKNAIGIHGGLQAKVLENVIARVGAFYDKTPIQDGYVSPELPDNNKIGLTFGATYTWRENLLVTISFLYENVKARTVTNIETGLSGTYKSKVIAPGVGLTYYFGKITKRAKRYKPRYTGSK